MTEKFYKEIESLKKDFNREKDSLRATFVNHNSAEKTKCELQIETLKQAQASLESE